MGIFIGFIKQQTSALGALYRSRRNDWIIPGLTCWLFSGQWITMNYYPSVRKKYIYILLIMIINMHCHMVYKICLVVWNMALEHEFILPIDFHIFQRGIPPTSYIPNAKLQPATIEASCAWRASRSPSWRSETHSIPSRRAPRTGAPVKKKYGSWVELSLGNSAEKNVGKSMETCLNTEKRTWKKSTSNNLSDCWWPKVNATALDCAPCALRLARCKVEEVREITLDKILEAPTYPQIIWIIHSKNRDFPV